MESAYRRHADELVRFATVHVGPHDAADVVTDALLNVFGRERRGEVESLAVDDLRAYLYRAVHHRIVDAGRSAARRRRRESQYAAERVTTATVESPSVDARRVLSHLTDQQRSVVFLAYWCDMSVPMIAATLDVGDGTARKQLARARARLREVLDDR